MPNISSVNLSSIDLNLLIAFDTLMSTRNVTRAAEQLKVTQPAMSNILRRLRETLQDPVLVRTKEGMLPTRRALELIGPVRAGLGHLQSALHSTGGFDPALSTDTIRIATEDYCEFVLFPQIAERLCREAPGLKVQIRPISGRLPIRALQTGEVDLVVSPMFDTSTGMHCRKLFKEDFACLLRKGHPAVKKRISLRRYASLKHVLVSPSGGTKSYIDDMLAERGMHREVALTTPHFLAAPFIVARSDYVLTALTRVAEAFAQQAPLSIYPSPLSIPKFWVHMTWHELNNEAPKHRWFRQLVLEEAAKL